MTRSDMDDLKASLRRMATAARRLGDPAQGVWLAAHVMAQAAPRPGHAVAGFWPMGTEIDIRPLLLALAGRGHTLLLPATPPRGRALTFHRWGPGDVLVPERFGTFRPTGPVGTPDVVLVPLLAFDARGHRLGYGGGYYDRTLAALPGCLAIGCAFAGQQVDAVPTGSHDMRLHAVATERGVTFF